MRQVSTLNQFIKSAWLWSFKYGPASKGYLLQSDSGCDVSISGRNWGSVLSMAVEYGWYPLGCTLFDKETMLQMELDPEIGLEWDGSYLRCGALQYVEKRDARNLGHGLDCLLDDATFYVKTGSIIRKDGTKMPLDCFHEMKTATEVVVAAGGIEKLREVALLCRQGGFHIIDADLHAKLTGGVTR